MTAVNERFWNNIEVGDCWLWLGGVNPGGYGKGYDSESKKMRLAHRLVWQELVGPIPDKLTIDHLCQNKRCVNPDHMEVVDRVTNWRRAPHYKSRRQFCRQGHPLLYTRSDGRRSCEICGRIQRHAANKRLRHRRRREALGAR